MHNTIRSNGHWLLVIAGGKSIIHNNDAAVLVSLGYNKIEIADLESGVGRGFKPDQLSIRFEGAPEHFRTSEISECEISVLHLAHDLSEITLGAPIDIIDHEDMIFGIYHLQIGSDNLRSAWECDSIFAFFK